LRVSKKAKDELYNKIKKFGLKIYHHFM